jgi:hypothetical protein
MSLAPTRSPDAGFAGIEFAARVTKAVLSRARLPGRLPHAFARAAALAVGLFAFIPALAATLQINNTASVSYATVQNLTVTKPSNALTLTKLDTPACTTARANWYQYVPPAFVAQAPGVLARSFDGGEGNNHSALPPVTAFGSSTALSLSSLPSLAANAYHAGEPLLLALTDGNRNIDPTVRESLRVTLSTSYST